MTSPRESTWSRRRDRGESPQIVADRKETVQKRRGYWIGDTPYPVTIISTRYGGCYETPDGASEPAHWAAFHCDEDAVPGDATGGDIECCEYWQSMDASDVGRGATPNAALEDLKARLSG